MLGKSHVEYSWTQAQPLLFQLINILANENKTWTSSIKTPMENICQGGRWAPYRMLPQLCSRVTGSSKKGWFHEVFVKMLTINHIFDNLVLKKGLNPFLYKTADQSALWCKITADSKQSSPSAAIFGISIQCLKSLWLPEKDGNLEGRGGTKLGRKREEWVREDAEEEVGPLAMAHSSVSIPFVSSLLVPFLYFVPDTEASTGPKETHYSVGGLQGVRI